jgi:hypothetical protein
MSNQSDEASPQPKPESSKEADSKQVPEVLPPALEGALETAGVDVSNPQVTKAIQVSASFFVARGSLPIMPPEILAQYEQEFPGLGYKLVEWTAQQRNHRQSLEKQRTDGSEKRMERGQFIAGGVRFMGPNDCRSRSNFWKCLGRGDYCNRRYRRAHFSYLASEYDE